MGRHHTTGTAGTVTSDTATDRHRRRRWSAAAVVATLALSLTACGSDDDGAETASTEEAMDDGGAIAGGEDATADVAESAGDAEQAAAETGGAASAGLPIGDFGRDIIRNVGLTMQTSDVGETADAVRRIVAENGGAVFGSDVTIADEEADGSVPGGGQIVVRVPPDDLDRLVTDLDGAGFVSRLTQDSQDVTDQLVDLDIRIRQAETGIERIEVLLEQASVLDDVFAIETELTNRQVELERLRAAERSTEDRVQLATLTIQIEHRAPDALDELDEPADGIGDAFADGWSAFVGALFAVGFLLAVTAPFLVTALAILALAVFVGRRWSRRQETERERRRVDADRRGHLPGVAPTTSTGRTPPPPHASERSSDDATAETEGTDTIVETSDDDQDVDGDVSEGGGDPSPED